MPAARLSGLLVFTSPSPLWNTADSCAVRWAEIGLPEGAAATVRDLFARRDLGRHSGEFTAEVKPLDVVALRITPVDAAAEGADDWRPWHGQRMFAAHSDGGAALGGGEAGAVRAALYGAREQAKAAAA